MSITYYLTHNTAVRVLSIVMVVMMLMACCLAPTAKAAGEGVGMALIVAILNAFGISVSTSGTIAGMTSGLSDLMEQFSQQMYDNAQHFKELFNANITMIGWGIAKIGSALTQAISDFISWLKSIKSLSPTNPIVSSTLSTITINGQSIPIIPYNGYVYIIGSTDGRGNLATGSSIYGYDLITDYTTIDTDSPYPILGSNYYLQKFRTSFTKNSNVSSMIGYSVALLIIDNQYLIAGSISSSSDGLLFRFNAGRAAYDNFHNTKILASVLCSTVRQADGIIPVSALSGAINGGESWVINDDNLNLGFLDNEDGSTKDVYFTPALPDIVDHDLSTVGGLSEAAELQLEYTYDITGTGEIAGTMDITSELEPGSGGSGNVPPIVIPSNGWFTSIWHYVVKALQDSAAGIAFIIELIQEVIPSEILNLAWASCVLLITFGILNKFLK